VLEGRVAHWRELGERDQRELAGHLQVMLDEKRFEGCGGLELDDEVRLTIAAQACLLLLHRDTDYFPGVLSIVVYPSVYWAPRAQTRPGGVLDTSVEVREGESWERGAVVLAWDRVLSGAADAHSGQNVVLHEFAHQLDVESGDADGAPPMRGRAARRAWAEAFSEAYEGHRRALAEGAATLLDPYGATNPAEFFAVTTETFFERPRALAREHPALYAVLAGFFHQEPAARLGCEAQTSQPGEGFWTISIDAYGEQPIV
jgi:MtfA peptidase